ncbi:hypothetical protein KC367_g5642 [Hortaea werneckii]|uniref:Norsolorinic acid ketoreductase n=1 Tax=Hortaea werneckii EXF-2000 TaxID=1157616 RepID=A0A1Z5TA20_HORWE|nr:hypothetical protein KC358_g13171 [Hortaea werneckii]OTA32864.1 hypothetical protein BTJ68_08020 [Hortaea werneckii EXF-2000]KAI6808297.1 hypothetical protein KC342_g18648 [Hortaea werneckii]KAI6809568.1 hypothetical protein KC350_g12885 [Hortaea werneckii]KAI6910331.1 hypothetical protein KC348_g13243 [Hortaea werneckii]
MPHSEHSTPESIVAGAHDDNTIYLITGANRGIGLGFVRELLSRPNTTVIATMRSLSQAAGGLNKLPVATNSYLIPITIDCLSDQSPHDAVHELQQDYNIDRLDVIIANAGIEKWFGPIGQAPLDELRDHFEVNSVAPVALFQATLPLLQRSRHPPKFIPISSRLGSMTEIEKVKNPAAVYGASKAMLNYLTCRMHFENPELIAFPMSPGFVQTDMGNAGARKGGLEKAYLTVEQSVTGMLKTIDKATREEHGATLQSWDGTRFEW